ncbi:hypothetical protein L7F22_014692 [Adiantum nelumboides]|nr:hypothetical protein [Adiantum nelumboides]
MPMRAATLLGMLLLLLLRLCSKASCSLPAGAALRPPVAGGAGAAAAANMNPSELEALFQVMESLLDVSNLRVLHPRPCTQDLFPGMVMCEEGGDKLMHVTRLQVGGSSSYTRQRCKVSATIPGSAMAQLPFLRTLLISECIMSQRTTIPALQLAPSLQELSLRSNKALVGSIPAAVGRLKSLQVLSLAQNNLQGSVPAAVAGLKMLEHLDLSYNVLSGNVPALLGRLPSLSILDLSGNLLQGSIPSSFGGLKALQKLDLSSNQLKGTIPPQLGSLRNLQFLALSGNGFTGPLPPSLAGLSNLEYFLMDSNPIRGALPAYVLGGSWAQLRELSLADSSLTGPISAAHPLFNISVINLSNNKLQGSIPPSLEQLQQLSYLNLSQNFLSGAVPFSAHFIQKLSNRLDLHGNPGLCVSATSFIPGDLLTAQQLHPCDSRAALANQGAGATASLHHRSAASTLLCGSPPPELYYSFLCILFFSLFH